MSPADRRQRLEQLRRRLRILWERLKDATDGPALTIKGCRERVAYYTTAIAEARARPLELEGSTA